MTKDVKMMNKKMLTMTDSVEKMSWNMEVMTDNMVTMSRDMGIMNRAVSPTMVRMGNFPWSW